MTSQFVTWSVGDRVVVRTANNDLQKATVVPVPRKYRDDVDRLAWTTYGKFPKSWVEFEDGHRCPWPIADVFTDLDKAKARVIEGAIR